MKKFNCFNCCPKQSKKHKLTIILTGLQNSGKTEIAYGLCKEKRLEFSSTNGASIYHTSRSNNDLKIIELGGSVYGIWKHYYSTVKNKIKFEFNFFKLIMKLQAMGVIYVVDSTNVENIRENINQFKEMISHNFLIGKPFLILANKQDLENSIDFIEIGELLQIENLANKLRTPCSIKPCSMIYTDINGQEDGIQWLIQSINENWKDLKNRLNFDKEFQLKQEILERPMTAPSATRKRSFLKTSRPKSANHKNNQITPITNDFL